MKAASRHLALALVLLGAAAPITTACSPYTVVQQSGPPSALAGVKQVQVRFDWSQVRVLGKSEAEYLAEKDAGEQADFQVIKQETDAAIMEGLTNTVGAGVSFSTGAGPLDPAQAAVMVQYVDVQTGIYTPVYSAPSKVAARFSWGKDGTWSDIIDTSGMVGASMTTPSDHQRMGMVGKMLGKAAGKFFIEAQGGK
ncbi:MAG: hypothetical protein JNK56_02360 [Myxococcales bacterium]|nr:hypothetical protein [Myxococcales bacterium]